MKEYQFIERLKKLPFVDALWLFGSRARGDHHSRSDIDIAVICPTATDQDWLKVFEIIETADTLLKIDCVRLEKGRLSDELCNNIERDKKVIYEMDKSTIKLEKFKKALASLTAIYQKPNQEDRSNIDATIQRFEFTFELAWKFLKDFFFQKGIVLNYPKEILQQAFASELISDEQLWLQMLSDRNMTSHTYDEKLADEIYSRIPKYVPLLICLLNNISDQQL